MPIELKADDPDLPYLVSTEGQMGVIVEATLRVGERPPAHFPFAIPFFESKDAFSLAKDLAKQPDITPDDVIIFHSELVRVLPIPSRGGGSSHPQNLVLVGFAQEEPADRFRRYLTERGIKPAEEKVAQFLWEERSLPMSIKPLGPSLLAAEVVLPLDRVAAYQERVRDWGQRLGVTFEDVKAFIDGVRMINPRTTICIKVSPSPNIEFIVSGLARIAKDNRMVIEVWLDGPGGGTGAAPDIIKGQMGMHMEYAIPICHEKLMDDGLRDFVVFTGSGGFRTWADIIKGVAMGLDGVILGTADLAAIGCLRDRNCESGCRSGISTLEPRMQRLRDIEMNTRQIINFRAILQTQVIRITAENADRLQRPMKGEQILAVDARGFQPEGNDPFNLSGLWEAGKTL